MIRIAACLKSDTVPTWHAAFLAMLPAIRTHARVAFRDYDRQRREELIEEVVANALVAYVRLVEQGKADVAYPTPLARFGVAQVLDGRRVGSRLRIGDVLSPYAQKKKGFVVERLDHFDEQENAWEEAVVQDTRTSPVPDIVSFRVDFADWLIRLSRRNRRIAESLAVGNCTGETDKKFRVSASRISQLRNELQDSWETFQGEPTADKVAVATA